MVKHTPLLILLLIFQSLYSQDTGKKFRIGVKVGASFSSLLFAEKPYTMPKICAGGCSGNNDNQFNYEVDFWNSNRAAFTFGAVVEKNLGKKNQGTAELNYELKGLDLEYSATDVTFVQTPSSESIVATYRYIKRDIRNNYLTISTLFKHRVGQKEKVFVVGGLYTGYLLRSSVSGRDMESTLTFYSPNWTVPATTTVSESRQNTDDARPQTRRFDPGISGGGGWEFSLSPGLTVALELRANLGLLKIASDSNDGSASYMDINPNARNLNVNLSACLFYKL